MAESPFSHRLATRDDLPVLTRLMNESIRELLKPFLAPPQIAVSFSIMGLDTQLVDDGTYYVIEADGRIAGCGGWSRRLTLYGSNRTAGRDSALLDPETDPARIRAMYTDPGFTRRGIGRLVMSLCEENARADGFRQAQLMATMAGAPLYRKCGYVELEHTTYEEGDVSVPLIRMGKDL